ncbi:hypothetical protein FUAX_18840 [Fulvitalea axinellae]|uniref:DUF4178 domain-containing protein n=1 Tax=Fulvitalea axinellae TaxID=1182444 RepID=A0AAU9CR45_9BACT|nr:hypothetical protein FUAX_18840 [Fulvitalea axinellae]
MARIIFGTRSVKIKSYDAGELEMSELGNAKVEYRQKYFHLYFIPFFPTSKFVALRKQDGELYEIPRPIRHEILKKIKKEPSTPWISFLGPILLLLAGGIYLGNEAYDDYKIYRYSKHSYELTAEWNMKLLGALNTDDFIKVEGDKINVESVDYLKVEEIQGDSLLVSGFETSFGYRNNLASDIQQEYLNNIAKLKTVWVKRDVLRSAVYEDYDEYKSEDTQGISILKTEQTYFISRIDRLDGAPLIRSEQSGGYSSMQQGNSRFSVHMDLSNYGGAGKIVRIENMSGEINWTTPLPLDLGSEKSERRFSLSGDNYSFDFELDFVLHIMTKDGKLVKYRALAEKGDYTPGHVFRMVE